MRPEGLKKLPMRPRVHPPETCILQDTSSRYDDIKQTLKWWNASPGTRLRSIFRLTWTSSHAWSWERWTLFMAVHWYELLLLHPAQQGMVRLRWAPLCCCVVGKGSDPLVCFFAYWNKKGTRSCNEFKSILSLKQIQKCGVMSHYVLRWCPGNHCF